MNEKRLKLVIFLLFAIGAAIIYRLFSIQIIKGNYYKALAKGQQRFFEEAIGERGKIYFGSGQELAKTKTSNFVYISPREIKDKEKTTQALTQILDLKQQFVEEKIAKDSYYELIKNKVSDLEIERLNKINFSGIHVGQKNVRSFPQGTMASKVIGFVDADGTGQYGLENYYQEILAGKQGIIEGEKGPSGFLISLSSPNKMEKGSDLVLALDYQVQLEAEKLLAETKDNLDIESGTIIVIDPASGKIIAMANYPNFDPNAYENEKDISLFKNQAIQTIFEPGSVFKPITMAAAIEENKISPDTVYTDKGMVMIGKTLIYNYSKRTYGEQTMTQVLEKSINSGAVFAEQQLGSKLFLEYLKKFSFFDKTDIDLQGEVFSSNQEFKKGYEINFATASFGQGIEITPIQLVKAFSAIANNGKMVKPFMITKIIDSQGAVKETIPEFSQQIISKETALKVTSMMTSVIENGYGKAARIPGYFIAGKTGTAQVSWPALGINKPGYSDKTVQSFIGFAPAFNPRFLILIKLDNPKTKTAEYSAIPVFHDLAKYIIDLWQIPPDYEP